MRTIFFGTPNFAIPALQKLKEADFEIVGVFTEPSRPVGRHQEITPSPVKLFAEKSNLAVFEPESLKTSPFSKGGEGDFWAKQIKSLAPDIAVVAAYGQIIPQAIIDIPKYGFINIHPSLLPKYRGASPVQFAILNGERETGVTIMLMDEKMDHGPILAQEKIAIGDDEDTPSLLTRAAELGAKMLSPTIEGYLNKTIVPQEQNHEAATFSKILKKADGQIDWQKSALEIYNQIRAFRPWPGTWNEFKIKNSKLKIKILDASPSNESTPEKINIGNFFVSPPLDLQSDPP
ncbi:MAG: methionyl-tRNA formyltransferase, partial [Patescibacteria group bacterium]